MLKYFYSVLIYHSIQNYHLINNYATKVWVTIECIPDTSHFRQFTSSQLDYF